MNSLVIVLFLSGMVAMIMLRTLHKDIARYNQMDSVVSSALQLSRHCLICDQSSHMTVCVCEYVLVQPSFCVAHKVCGALSACKLTNVTYRMCMSLVFMWPGSSMRVTLMRRDKYTHIYLLQWRLQDVFVWGVRGV